MGAGGGTDAAFRFFSFMLGGGAIDVHDLRAALRSAGIRHQLDHDQLSGPFKEGFR